MRTISTGGGWISLSRWILKVTKEEGQKLATQYNMKFFEAPNETKTPAKCLIQIVDVIGALFESHASEFF